MLKQILQIFYTVDNPTKNWKGGAGYISKDMAVKGLPSPSDDTLILVSFAFHVKLYSIYRTLRFKQFEPLGSLFLSIYICLMVKITNMMINIAFSQLVVVTPIDC